MSKSKGAVLSVTVLKEQGYDPLSFRYFCLSSHYRKQLVFTYPALDGAQTAYKKLKSKVLSLSQEGNIEQDKFDEYKRKFTDYLEDDLNTSNALTLVYDLLKDENVNDITKFKLIEDFDNVLALDLTKKEEVNEFSEEEIKYIESKIEERKEHKKNKEFDKADAIRNELLEKGIELLDTREGTKYKRA